MPGILAGLLTVMSSPSMPSVILESSASAVLLPVLVPSIRPRRSIGSSFIKEMSKIEVTEAVDGEAKAV